MRPCYKSLVLIKLCPTSYFLHLSAPNPTENSRAQYLLPILYFNICYTVLSKFIFYVGYKIIGYPVDSSCPLYFGYPMFFPFILPSTYLHYLFIPSYSQGVHPSSTDHS